MTTIAQPSVSAPRVEFSALPIGLYFGPHKTVLRPLQSNDAGRLLEFFSTHSRDTVYRRYGYDLQRMTPLRAAALVNVDQSRDVALGVFDHRPTRRPLIAVGRYFVTPADHSAEVAFVVREDRRGLGIATTLMSVLVETARSRGLTQLTAQVHADNREMIAVLRKFDAGFFRIPETASFQAVIDLAETGT